MQPTGGSTTPRVTAIVCTHNRAELLRGCLDTLLRQTLDPSAYEIVVVDNASTDDTAAVVAELQAHHASRTIILAREPRLGLSYARNAGVRLARARIVAFADDDDLVPEHWLEHGVDLFDRLGESAMSIGGPVFPCFLRAPPDWFLDRYETSSWGEEPRYLVYGESFVGNNVMFRRDVLQALGGFPEHIGMLGASMAYGEETWVYCRLWEQDKSAKFFYSPTLYVHHCIPPWKTTVTYCIRRGFAVGQATWELQPPKSVGSVRWMPPAMRASVGVVRASIHALVRLRRHNRWQRWAVEELGPVAEALGRLSWCFGNLVSVRQRPGGRKR
ncbi:MAG: glycosyltransferase family 2 protein [Betaproteobacteria bacterium]|nr:glycosyltransferase family 2 protein [Betaproteobacteria bacterium]